MAEREPGPYWVNHSSRGWDVAYWNQLWTMTGDEQAYHDEDFAEIGERVERRVPIPFKGEPVEIDPAQLKPRVGRVIYADEHGHFTREQIEEALKYDWGQAGKAAAPQRRFLIEDRAPRGLGISWKGLDVSESETFHDVEVYYEPAFVDLADPIQRAAFASRASAASDTRLPVIYQPALWPEPQPITDAQKTGERFLVWHKGGAAMLISQPVQNGLISSIGPFRLLAGWYSARWSISLNNIRADGRWILGDLRHSQGALVLDLTERKGAIVLLDNPRRYLPLPPDVPSSSSEGGQERGEAQE